MRPRVRLSKLVHTHVRVVELLRFLRNKKGTCRLDHINFYEEMARRGMMDPATAIIRLNGAAMPTEKARGMMYGVVALGLDLMLIDHAYPTDNRKRHIYSMTHDGAATLRDWDDPEADGLWARP